MNFPTRSTRQPLNLIFGVGLLLNLIPNIGIGQSAVTRIGTISGRSANANETCEDIKVDANGYTYVTGDFEYWADFDPGSGEHVLHAAYEKDGYVAKYDPNLNLVWVRQFRGSGDDTGWALEVDDEGNVYCSGRFENWIDIDPGPTEIQLQALGDFDAFLVKLDANGNYLWGFRYGYINADTYPKMCLDADGNLINASTIDGGVNINPLGATVYMGPVPVNVPDFYVCKRNPDGEVIWAKRFGNSGVERAFDVTVDPNNNILVCGVFDDTTDFDPGAGILELKTTSDDDGFILKLDTDGNAIWVKQITSTYDNSCGSIISDATGHVYVTGYTHETTDLDPGVDTVAFTVTYGNWMFLTKLDADGNFVWGKYLEGNGYSSGMDLAIDQQQNVYTSGTFNGTMDFDPGIGDHSIESHHTPANTYNYDGYVLKLNEHGEFKWVGTIGDTGYDAIDGMAVDHHNDVHVSGKIRGTAEFISPTHTLQQIAVQAYDGFFATYRQRGVYGKVYHDLIQNCIQDEAELDLFQRWGVIEPGNIIVQTNGQGVWSIDSLPAGNYTATFDTIGNWIPACAPSVSFAVPHPDSLVACDDFGMINTRPCASPQVSIGTNVLRRCFTDQVIYGEACNTALGTEELTDAYVELRLDSLLTPTSGTPFTVLGNNTIRIELGTLLPGQCETFQINVDVSCETHLAQTLCMEARLFPMDSCVFDTIPANTPTDFSPCNLPWDHSSLALNGWCQNDSAFFTIKNNGAPLTGDMICFSPIRLYIDGQYMWLDSLKLPGGQADTLIFNGDGRTYRLEVDQHPLHSGNSNPNLTIELCGDTLNWTAGMINVLPVNESNPFEFTHCRMVTGAYDPNDKTGLPLGVTTEHFISPDGRIDYMIRFQNTGNDTAFNVVIRDSIDTDLNLFSVNTGVSSHNYNFSIHTPRVFEWRFYDIMLPDSTTDLAGSQGFVSFSIAQQPGLADGTVISNEADIYFDYNEPIITNQTEHVIDRGITSASWSEIDTIMFEACDSYTYNDVTFRNSGVTWMLVNDVPSDSDTLMVIYTIIHSTSDLDLTITEQSGSFISNTENASSYQWLNCDLNFVPIVGETSQALFPNGSGNFAVIVEENGCIDTTDCYNLTLVGLDNQRLTESIIYPNPAQHQLNLSNNYPDTGYFIHDSQGRIILRGNTQGHVINVSSLASGMYILRLVMDENTTISSRFEVLR